jgi:uncharacterized SAM-binding protein YcdF (DUF218 family)
VCLFNLSGTGTLDLKKKYFTSSILKNTGLVFLLLIILLFSGGCLGHYKRTANKELIKAVKNNQTFDAIIVPGIPFTGAYWGHLMRVRVVWSWILYKNGIAKNVIYSGGAVHTPYQEALVMGLYAEKLGIPRENIFYDTCAQHSTENVYYSYMLARRHGFKSIAVASDIYQCFFLRSFIKKRFKNTIVQLPVVPDTLASYVDMDLIIDPSSAVIHGFESFVPISEKQSYFHRLKGTFGRNIDWKRENEGTP